MGRRSIAASILLGVAALTALALYRKHSLA